MPSLMLKVMATVIGVVFLVAAAAPADAAKARKHKQAAAAHASVRVPARYRNPTLFPPGPVYFGREYLGDDPDPFIRFQLYRDLGAHFGGEN